MTPRRRTAAPRGPRRGTTPHAPHGRATGVRALPPSGAAATYARALLDLDAQLSEAILSGFAEEGLVVSRGDAAADGAGRASP